MTIENACSVQQRRSEAWMQPNPRARLSSGSALLVVAMLMGCTAISGQEEERVREALNLKPGDVVADIGAGDGTWTAALSGIVGEHGKVWATEVDPKDVKKIESRVERSELNNVGVVQSTQEDAGLETDCCDAILLRRVYHHFTKPRVMRREMARALRNDGLLLVVDFEADRGWSRPSGIPEDRKGHGLSKEKLIREMQSDGFSLRAELDWTRGDYALVFQVAAPR